MELAEEINDRYPDIVAETAALVANLPPHYGPVVDGTADDLIPIPPQSRS